MSKWRPPVEKMLSQDQIKTLRTSTEEKAIIDVSKGRCLWVKRWLLVDLLLGTGLRINETANVQVKHLDINVKDKSLFVEHGKGNKQRYVFLPNELSKHLKHYINVMKLNDNDFLLSHNGKKYTTRGLQKQWRTACLNAGITDKNLLWPHTARHSYCSILYRKSLDIRLCQEQLGHSTPAITALYSHLSKSERSSGVQGLFEP
jgi:integrase/recombinase XerD